MMKREAQMLLEGPCFPSSESFSIFLPLKFSNSYFKVIFLWDDVYYLSNALPRRTPKEQLQLMDHLP